MPTGSKTSCVATPRVPTLRPQPFTSALLCSVVLAFCSAVPVAAQEFTAADSGWVRLFNGTNFDGFYSRTYNVGGANAPLVTPPASPYTIEYAGTDTATIRVGTTGNQGNIGTLDTTFSHYRLRWESKYDAVNSNSNSGMTYHVDESAIRMQNNWPRSIEFQGKQNEIGSAFSIQQVTFSSRTSSAGQGANYVATGGTLINACEIGCNGRWYRGNPLITPYASDAPSVPRWLRFHLVARGADSAIHIVNDTTVFRLWNIRIFNDSTRATGSNNSGSNSRSNMTPNKPWDRGGLAWQAEGATVRYRRLEVMRLPPSTPMNAHYLHRVILDSPTSEAFYQPGGTATIRWRSIGAIPKVKIEYQYTVPRQGSWVTIADSAPNTGSYAWTLPMEAQGLAKAASTVYTARMRISSSLDYVRPDTSEFHVAWGTSLLPRPLEGTLSFGTSGGAVVLAGLSTGTRVEIRDVAGQLIRTLTVAEAPLVWDRRNADGAAVPAGLYLARALRDGVVYRTGKMLMR